MKTVYLLRHAKAEAGDATLSDADRPLAERGREACETIGKYIIDQHIKPNIVLCSTAVRTRQTWELTSQAAGISPKVDYNKKLYLAGAGEMFKQLQALDDAYESAVIVAHNPGVHECVLKLCAHGSPKATRKIELKFPTGAMAVVQCEIEKWSQLKPQCGFLTDFFTPKDSDD